MTQSGEVVSHQAHNLGTGGANPSSATKHGVFMIAIDFHLTHSTARTFEEYKAVCRPALAEFKSFFVECLDEGCIVNAQVQFGSERDRFFANTQEDAEKFLDKFQDTSREFCPKTWSNSNGIFYRAELSEVDFDSLDVDMLEVVENY